MTLFSWHSLSVNSFWSGYLLRQRSDLYFMNVCVCDDVCVCCSYCCLIDQDMRKRSNRKRGFKTSELPESPFEEIKKMLNQHLKINIPTHHLTNTMYVSLFGWKRFRSTRRSLFSRIQKKNISHLLLKLLKCTPIPSLRNVTIQTYLSSMYIFFGNFLKCFVYATDWICF